jgi:hypothetical protein
MEGSSASEVLDHKIVWKGVEELDSTAQKWISPPLEDAAV